ncbi:hypothetical protein K7G98_11540 [Saccharothrix sp. MB29]|nr:hypothetical protein [Saccharothrix sp. MB29]
MRNTLMPLVEALRRIPAMADRSGRELVVRMLAEELREHLPVEDHKYPVGHLFSIAEVCSRKPERLTALLRVVESVEQGSRPMAALRDLVRGMTTLELWSPETRAELFALLSGVVVPDIEHVYLVVGGSLAPRLRGHTTYAEVFRTLEALNARPDGVPRSLLFVEPSARAHRTDRAAAPVGGPAGGGAGPVGRAARGAPGDPGGRRHAHRAPVDRLRGVPAQARGVDG